MLCVVGGGRRPAAELLGAKAIVTRDASAYARSLVPSMDAQTFCAQQA